MQGLLIAIIVFYACIATSVILAKYVASTLIRKNNNTSERYRMQLKVIPIIVHPPNSTILLIERMLPDGKENVWDFMEIYLPERDYKDTNDFINDFMLTLSEQVEFSENISLSMYDLENDRLSCIIQSFGVCQFKKTGIPDIVNAGYFEFEDAEHLPKSERLELFLKKHHTYMDVVKSTLRVIH